jgi:hypothetical protein
MIDARLACELVNDPVADSYMNETVPEPTIDP